MIDLPAVFERQPWGLVVVRGADATSFLQAVVSQDLDPVAVGDTVASLLLHPQGKLDVAFRATRRAATDDGDEWWLDTEADFGPHLADALGRYRIRVQAEIEDRTERTAAASVVGGDEVPDLPDPPERATAIAARWGERPGVDVVGPAADVSAWIASLGLRTATREELEVVRIEARVPRLGIDVDESTIPQEAFLERDAVSFTKGCFIGQELVCRIDTRGHVNRFLRTLELSGDAVPAPGAEVVVEGKVVGAITSASAVPGEGRVVALATIRREVEPPADVTVVLEGATVPASVTA